NSFLGRLSFAWLTFLVGSNSLLGRLSFARRTFLVRSNSILGRLALAWLTFLVRSNSILGRLALTWGPIMFVSRKPGSRLLQSFGARDRPVGSGPGYNRKPRECKEMPHKEPLTESAGRLIRGTIMASTIF